jgi:hypothetical protein
VLSRIAKSACQQQIDQQNSTTTEKHMHKAKNCIFQKESYKIVGTFSKVQQSKEPCATERCFSGLHYQLMPKKKMSAMAWLECYPFFLVWVPEFQNTLRFLKTTGHKTCLSSCSTILIVKKKNLQTAILLSMLIIWFYIFPHQQICHFLSRVV